MPTEQTLNWIFAALSLLGGLGLGWFARDAWKEGERRAVRVSLLLMTAWSSFFLIAIYFTFLIKTALFFTIMIAIGLFLFLCLLPIGKLTPDIALPTRRVDERTIMFARNRLQPGTPAYHSYYQEHPEHRGPDERTRARPGLFSPNSKYTHPLTTAASRTSFRITKAMHQMVEGTPEPEQHQFSPEQATEYIKWMAHHYGAVDVGITELKPYHVYSHIGRGPGEYGAPIELNHRYAIAFTVEMDFPLVKTAPHGSISIESAHQYVEAGKISIQLAEAIRMLGYPARAHMDANYRVICPLVARDAGLGEIGRITLLMTPNLGPRVRLGVVTTDLPLISDPPGRDPSVIDFCNICRKCAENCPSKSISFEERSTEDGVLRWRLNPDTCFAYWNQIGTDCGICMSVCPYSHPDTFLHNTVRFGISKSGFFRRFALWLDDLFYGKHPTQRTEQEWNIGKN